VTDQHPPHSGGQLRGERQNPNDFREEYIIKKAQFTSTTGTLEGNLSFRGDSCTCESSGSPRQLTKNNVFLS